MDVRENQSGRISETLPTLIAAPLRYWRVVKRIKQSHLAEMLSVSQATVSRWESGACQPAPSDLCKIAALLSARLDGAADRELARLVNMSPSPMHLMCDVTHRLLALSPGRAETTTICENELIGEPLWRFASDEIIEFEERLGRLGWFEGAIDQASLTTGGNKRQDYHIIPGEVRYVRFRLSDGTHARLVESMTERAGSLGRH